MVVSNTESVTVAATPERAFELAFDIEQMPKLLVGWGPVPAVERVEMVEPGEYAVGKVRRIHNSDGSSLDEQILVHEPPHRHGYRLSGGFRGLAKLLVREGRSDWEFEALAGKTTVRWRYEFTLTTPLVWPVGVLMMKVAFANMQNTALAKLRTELERGAVAA